MLVIMAAEHHCTACPTACLVSAWSQRCLLQPRRIAFSRLFGAGIKPTVIHSRQAWLVERLSSQLSPRMFRPFWRLNSEILSWVKTGTGPYVLFWVMVFSPQTVVNGNIRGLSSVQTSIATRSQTSMSMRHMLPLS